MINLSKSPFIQKRAAEKRGKTLSHQIVAVHVAYHSVEEQIHWFGQLTLCMPGILQHLLSLPQDSSEMVSVGQSDFLLYVFQYCILFHRFCTYKLFKRYWKFLNPSSAKRKLN